MDNNIYRKDREMKKGNYQEIMEEDLWKLKDMSFPNWKGLLSTSYNK